MHTVNEYTAWTLGVEDLKIPVKCQLNISAWLLIAYLVLKYNLDYIFQNWKLYKYKRNNNEPSNGKQTRWLSEGRHLILGVAVKMRTNFFPDPPKFLLPLWNNYSSCHYISRCVLLSLLFDITNFFEGHKNIIMVILAWSLDLFDLTVFFCLGTHFICSMFELGVTGGLLWTEFICSALQWLDSERCCP